MFKLISLWKSNLANTSKLQKFLAKAIAGTFGLKVVNAVLLYLNSLLLARVLGASGFGVYSYAGAWVNLLLIPAVFGFEGLIVRENTIYQTQSNWTLAKGLLVWSNKLVLTTSICVAVITSSIFWLNNSSQNLDTYIVIWISLASLPFMALSRLRQSSMQSINHIVMGQLPEMLVSPLILCIFLGLIVLVFPIKITAVEAVFVKTLAATVAFTVGATLLQASLSKQIKTAVPKYTKKSWLKKALPMLLIGSMYVVNNQTDTVMLGFLSNAEAVGIYTVANRGASLIGFVLLAFNTSLSPIFAQLYASGNKQQLQRIVTQCCRVVFAIALLITVILITFGQDLLSLFGSEFVRGQNILTILSIGQLINAFSGSVALLLIMTGHDKYTAIGVSISAILNIILNAILIPQFDAVGAGIATAISMIVWNVILIIMAQKKLKINSTALGKLW